jgi:nicotinate-nucleotide--dimethylbenzimidazole phosphoribosyltransferase
MTHLNYCKDGSRFRESVAAVSTLAPEWRQRAVARLDNLTKPLGSLGRLEEIAARLVTIREEERPRIAKKVVFTLAADHGVTDEGVSAYPKAVTQQMVLNFLSGGAAINVLARHGGIDVVVVDIGVDGDFEGVSGLVAAKVSRGSRNMVREAAMSEAEVNSALGIGVELAETAARQGYTLIGTGEMGIGNTTAASAITSVLTQRSVAQVTGRGTGLDEPGLQRKIEIIERAIAVNRPDASDPLDILRKVGGLEIA